MRTRSLLSSIHNQYLHFLWKKSKKRKVTVAGNEITYVRLFRWLLVGGSESKTTFVDAMRLVHIPTKTAMIFVADSKQSRKFLRYTLLHEYMECCYALGGKNYLEEQKPILEKIFVSLEKQVPHLMNALKKANCTPDHLFALIHETNLALKEMAKEEFEIFIADIIKNRL